MKPPRAALPVNWAQVSGVKIKQWGAPRRLVVDQGLLTGVEFDYTRLDEQGKVVGTGVTFTLAADMLFKAIGQTFVKSVVADRVDVLALKNGRLAVDADRKTSLARVWAGGDCVADGQDLTVAAVEDGKRAAHAIDRFLRAR